MDTRKKLYVAGLLAMLFVVSWHNAKDHDSKNIGSDVVISPQLIAQNNERGSLVEHTSSKLVVPEKFGYKKSMYVGSEYSWDGIVRSVSPEEAKYLQQANSNYFGALAFDNAKELQELVAKGFPLPEEWLEARSMTDQDLKALVDSGNVKAKAFYLDRLVNQASDYLDLRGVDDQKYQDSPGSRLSLLAYEQAAQVQTSYKSPFAGYLLGSTYSRLNYPPSPESAAAGILVAFDTGDERALNLMNTYQAQHPNMDITKIMAAYGALR